MNAWNDLLTLIDTYKTILKRIIKIDSRPISVTRWTESFSKSLRKWIEKNNGKEVDVQVMQAYAVCLMIANSTPNTSQNTDIEIITNMLFLALDGAITVLNSPIIDDNDIDLFVEDVYKILKNRITNSGDNINDEFNC